MGDNTRTLNWYEDPPNDKKVDDSKWVFNLCHKVAQDGGKAAYNVIWQSRGKPYSQYALSWQVEYALGWREDVPSSGVEVKIKGKWQPCKFGESYSIDKDGKWQASDADPTLKDWLSVSDINYIYPDADGCYLVIGVNAGTSDSPKWNPIYIAKNGLPIGSSAKFQPQEDMAWFLGDPATDTSGSVYTKTMSAVGNTKTNSQNQFGKYEWSTTFRWFEKDQTKMWLLTDGPPPDSTEALPAAKPVESSTIEALGASPFKITRSGGGSFTKDNANKLSAFLKKIWDNLKFSVTLSADKLSLSVSWGSAAADAAKGEFLPYCLKEDFEEAELEPTKKNVEDKCLEELQSDGISDGKCT